MDSEQQKIIGTGWGFPPTFVREQESVILVDGIEDIKQSLTILLNTFIGERQLRANYGCNLNEYLFETIDNSLCYYLRDLIEKAIVRHEKRIKVNQVAFAAKPDQGLIIYTIDFQVVNTSLYGNYVYPCYLVYGQHQP